MASARPTSIARCSCCRPRPPEPWRASSPPKAACSRRFWAGKRRAGQPARITLSAGFGEVAEEPSAYSYEVEIGVPPPGGPGAFPLEPDIKEEALLFHHRGRATKLLERRSRSVMARDADGQAHRAQRATCSRPRRRWERSTSRSDFPRSMRSGRLMLDWRFYHGLRTDAELAVAPALPCGRDADHGVGRLQSRRRARHADPYPSRHGGRSTVRWRMPFPARCCRCRCPSARHRSAWSSPTIRAASSRRMELSDGTLRYLALAGALLSLRLPAFVALNEPGEQPASRPARAARPADRPGFRTHADLAGHPFRAPRGGAREARRRAAAHGDQEGRRDLDRRPEADRPLRRRGVVS